jgi:hypothetical protein
LPNVRRKLRLLFDDELHLSIDLVVSIDLISHFREPPQ